MCYLIQIMEFLYFIFIIDNYLGIMDYCLVHYLFHYLIHYLTHWFK